MNAATTNVVITSEGTTTLSFFATDNEGNTSDVGTLTIRLDKTAPEALPPFDPARKDVVVFEQDSLSGTSPGVLTPSLVQRVPTGDRDLRAENRTYDVVDVAATRSSSYIRPV